MTTLWLASNVAFGSKVLVVADNANKAIVLAARITGYNLNWTAEPFVVDSLDAQDNGIELVEYWWGNYCDYADGNEQISDAEYDEILHLMKNSFAAVYAAGAAYEG